MENRNSIIRLLVLVIISIINWGESYGCGSHLGAIRYDERYGRNVYGSSIFIRDNVNMFGERDGGKCIGIECKGYVFIGSTGTNEEGTLLIGIDEEWNYLHLYRTKYEIYDDEDLEYIFIGSSTNEEVICYYQVTYRLLELFSRNDVVYVRVNSRNRSSYFGNISKTKGYFKVYNCQLFYKMVVEQFGNGVYNRLRNN